MSQSARQETNVPITWDHLFAQRTDRMQASDIREILKVTAMPDVISLAGGLPAPEVFPIEEFRRAFDKVLVENGAIALQYSASEGYFPLRELLAERLTRLGTPAAASNILITNGSQQALDLLGKIFLNPGDKVLLEAPSYLGAIQAFDSYQAEYAVIPMDEDGMVTSELDEILSRETVKFIYALPNFQNPSGRTMSLERRHQLVEVAARHGVPIVEDDPYGELRFEGRDLPSLQALDQDGLVIGLGTFSKILAPGLRLAWMVIPEHLYETVLLAKQPADLHTSTIAQMAVWEVCRDGFVDRHIETIKTVYRERRDAMLDALEAHFPPTAHWTKAAGGLFVWAELPKEIDTRELLAEAVRQKVAFVPGQSFFADRSGTNTMRLNFSNVTPERLHQGIERLGRAIEQRLARVPATS
jgi:2-aminoadipate transaminase